MVGNNSASIVADAYLKGLRGYDINTLYEALLKDANNEGPIPAVGRDGVETLGGDVPGTSASTAIADCAGFRG